jgi:3-oxoacyl-[acyl-carrier-protein] synthase-3
MSRRAVVAGCGACLPAKTLSNAELATRVETSDEWIQQRTGIRQRAIAAEGELTSDLAAAAGRAALAHAGIAATELDLILVATATPDRTFPATACRVQHLLGAVNAAAFDLQAVCSGFVYSLATARAWLLSGQARTVLVIGAETFSRILDWQDRNTCVLFGDGAGAFVLRAEDGPGTAGIEAVHIAADGSKEELLYVDGGPSRGQASGFVRMNGREVFRHAVAHLSEVIERLLTISGRTLSDIDWLVPHQANARILEGVSQRVGLPLDKVIVTVDRHANTSAASIPLAFCAGVQDGRIQRGQRLILEAMGGGFTWGGVLLEY